MRVRIPNFLWFPVALTLSLCGCGGSSEPGQIVLVISLDTLRADHLGCYGYARQTSPTMDLLASEEGVVFDAAYSHAPYTLPSHMSLLTSLYPEAHGVLEPTNDGEISVLTPEVVTLAEAMSDAGYTTAGFTDGLLVDSMYGFGDGFDFYEDSRFEDAAQNGFRKYGDRLHQYIRKHASEDLFLFVHTYDVHGPYASPDEYRGRFREQGPGRPMQDRALLAPSSLARQAYMELEQYSSLQHLIDRYDSTISYVDDELAKLFTLLEELGLWEQAMIVITSDHGENFLDKGAAIGHGFFATNEEVRVPLIIKFPGNRFASTRTDHVVEGVDVMPTVLAAVGVDAPEGMDGQNLALGLETGTWQKNHAYGVSPSAGGFSYLVRDGVKFVDRMTLTLHRIRSYFQPNLIRPLDGSGEVYPVIDRKLRYNFDTDPLALFDDFFFEPRAFDISETLFEWQAPEIKDPAVLEEMGAMAGAIAAMAREKHRRLVGDGADDEASQLSPEQAERLAALGYVEFAGHAGAADAGADGADGGESSDDPELDAEAYPDSPYARLVLDEPVQPFTREERGVLERGDRSVWRLWRMVKGVDAVVPVRERERFAEDARQAYRMLPELRADRAAHVQWRLRMIDMLLERLAASDSDD